MKLKATKYLLPTTDGRLHKELSYLISLHENKMNKGKLESRISDLEHKFKQLEHNYREACLELADRDNESVIIEGRPIESTQELFKNDDTSTTNDDTLTIEQLKDGDVLVFNGSRYAFFTKGKEYEVYDKGQNRLCIESDDDFAFRLETIDLDQFILKDKPITVKEFHPTDLPNTVDLLKPTPEQITSTTLKTPNEWLKLMSEEEVTQWEENRSKLKRGDFKLNMDQLMTFCEMINNSFCWAATPQGKPYWNNLSNRYNN